MARKKTDDAPASGLYALTFGDAPTTPAELYVKLPNGAKVYMNKFYKGDPGGDGWPYAEVALSADEAAVHIREYAKHGLVLAPIAASIMTPHPLATPQAPTE